MAPRLLRFRLYSLSICLLVLSAIAAAGQTIDFTSSPLSGHGTTASATLGVAYIYNAKAQANNGSDVRYSLRYGPSGMAINAHTGVVSWQPSGTGEFDAEIRAELADNPSINTTQNWKIAVSQALEHPGCTGNEAWLPVGRGLPGSAVASTEMGGELYVLHRIDQYPKFQVSKWNGSYWSAVTGLLIADFGPMQMTAYKNELYVAAFPHSSLGIPDNRGLMKWDGTAWSGVGSHNFESVMDMEVADGMLYVLGTLSPTGSGNQALARWDGTNWEMIHDGTGTQWPRWGTALATLNGKLYVACTPGTMGFDWNELPLLELNGSTLTPVNNRDIPLNNDYPNLDLIAHNGTLVLMTDYLLMQWDGTKTTVTNVDIPRSKRSEQRSAISYNNKLYVATWSSEVAVPMLLDYNIWQLADNNGWQPISSIQGVITENSIRALLEFIEYNGALYAYGDLSQSCGAALNNVAQLGTEQEMARVSGTVYHDDNRNCTVDGSEPTLEREIVEILPGPFYALTNAAGEFSTRLRPGTYTLSVSPQRNWTNACSVSPEVTLASPAAIVEGVNIGVDQIPGIYDVRSSIAAGRARPGFTFTYTITYWNSGTEPATGNMIFEHDNRLDLVSASTPPDRQNANILEWGFTNLPVGGSRSITVTMQVPASMEIGTEVCAQLDVELENKNEEEFLADNRDLICTTVAGSYDPNDIQVAPVRFDEELDNAPLLPGDTVLSYLVRFQNTGTDTAFTVVVTDTLDASLLDITSIQLGAASHPFDFDISGTGFLTWTFNDIMLPDSGANQLASHGYFKYSIRLKRGLPPLTAIPNRAAIYFDYNAPVITNRVVSRTSGTLSVIGEQVGTSAMQIYPNPVRGVSSITLALKEREQVTLRLIDSRGSVVAILNDKELNSGEHNFRLDSRPLSSGAYYLVLERSGEKDIYPVIVNR